MSEFLVELSSTPEVWLCSECDLISLAGELYMETGHLACPGCNSLKVYPALDKGWPKLLEPQSTVVQSSKEDAVEHPGASPLGVVAQVLFRLVRTDHGDSYMVVYWPNYGPVCPSLWTTNGSISYVANMTAEYVRSGLYEVQDARFEANFTDAQSIGEGLKSVCRTIPPPGASDAGAL
jgi:hypothetical protein